MESATNDLTKLGEQVVDVMQELFGKHPGFRATHAKGVLCGGNFQPTPAAALLSRAPHFAGKTVPITVRFSNFTGIPNIPDADPNASPHGMAVRFHVGDGVDIVAHSYNGFPVSTAEDFLEFLRALAQSGPNAAKPTPIEAFLASRPAAAAFVTTPKPAPAAFGTQSFYGINAFKFTNNDGVAKYARLKIHPVMEERTLSDSETANRSSDYLFEDLEKQLKTGAIEFRLVAQLAVGGDPVDDGSAVWPEDRPVIELGRLSVTEVLPNNAAEQRKIIFDPMHLIDGIAPSEDPLIEARSKIYAVAYARRNPG